MQIVMGRGTTGMMKETGENGEGMNRYHYIVQVNLPFEPLVIQWDLIPFGVGLLTHNLGSDKDIDVRTKGKNS